MTPQIRPRLGANVRLSLTLCASTLALACGAGDLELYETPPPLETEVAAASAPRVPLLEWEACGEDFPGAECAVAAVPLDYDDPRGKTTSIALAKIPAADQKHKLGTLFVNPGGPGASGVSLVLFGFGEALGGLLAGRFDVVGFDPRGVGLSDPLLCFENAAERDEFLASSPLFPYERSQERAFFESSRELTERCLARGKRIVSNMGTADVVRDLDLLRQAVGDKRLTYLGFSYGTYIGNTYANLFPSKVRALVIDGVLDPRLWSSGLQITSDRLASDAVLAEFFRLCDEAGDDCELDAPGGSAARYDALASALEKEPLIFEDGLVYSYDYLIGDTLSALYVPEYWGGDEGYAALFAFLADAVVGSEPAAREANALRSTLHERIKPPTQEPEFYDNSFEAYYGNQCADTEYPRSFSEFKTIGRYAEQDSRFGPYWWWSNAACANWPVSRDRYTGPWTARSSAPVLVVGNFFDPATDYAGAVASDTLLGNSRLLSYAGWGHTAFGRSACVTDHVVSYLVDGTLPPRNAQCPANANPFIPVEEPAALRMLAATAAVSSIPWAGLPGGFPAR